MRINANDVKCLPQKVKRHVEKEGCLLHGVKPLFSYLHRGETLHPWHSDLDVRRK